MSGNKNITISAFKQMWENDLLPSIKKEIQEQLGKMHDDFKNVNKRLDKIEESQKFISAKYDQVLESIKSSNKRIQMLEGGLKEINGATSNVSERITYAEIVIDEIQQYQRRDCLEIIGIPPLSSEKPKELMLEIASHIGVELNEDEISTIHRLPDTKNVKNRLIAKFVSRDKREEIYRNRSRLKGKTLNNHKIYINESLTANRKRLFAKILHFKRDNNFKYLWTANGKIYLKESETSRSFAFTNERQFQEFLDT